MSVMAILESFCLSLLMQDLQFYVNVMVEYLGFVVFDLVSDVSFSFAAESNSFDIV